MNFNNLVPGMYVFVESTKPTTVTQAAKPLFVALPITNAEGNGYLSDVHLYPKNVVESIKFDLIKHVWRNADVEASLFEGAAFDLYQGAPGAGTKVNEEALLTDAEGKITVTDLEVGSYYFVETATNEEGILIRDKFLNDAANLLSFTYNADGTITFPEGSLLAEGERVINYEDPTIEKAIEDSAAVNDFTVGDAIPYIVNSVVPRGFDEYVRYTITDNAVEGITVDQESIVITLVGRDGVETVYDAGASLATSERGYVLTLTAEQIAELAEMDLASIRINYNAIINDAAVVGTPQVNTVSLDWSNNNEEGSEEDTENVETYNHFLHKLGVGLFNSNIARADLAGAVFNVYRMNGEVKEYLVVAENSRTWVEDQTQATEFTTGENGQVEITGLAAGTYFAEEIKAPADYNLPLDPVTEFTITERAQEAEWEAGVTEIENERKPDLPMTGSEKVVLVAGGFVGLLGLALILGKKSKKEEAR